MLEAIQLVFMHLILISLWGFGNAIVTHDRGLRDLLHLIELVPHILHLLPQPEYLLLRLLILKDHLLILHLKLLYHLVVLKLNIIFISSASYQIRLEARNSFFAIIDLRLHLVNDLLVSALVLPLVVVELTHLILMRFQG